MCQLSRRSFHDVKAGRFAAGWHGLLPRLRERTWRTNAVCRHCNLLPLCGSCPGAAEMVRALAALPVEALLREPGLGRRGAERLAAALELGRRAFATEAARERPRLTRPAEVDRVVAGLARARRERLVALYLDGQNGLLHREVVSMGSLNVTRTAPCEIFHPAIAHSAVGVILAHNHPSGCLEPSLEDVEFTRGVQRAGSLLGIELSDHLIVAGVGYTSLRERGIF